MPSRTRDRCATGCALALLALTGCGGTQAETPVALHPHQRREPAFVRARASAAQAETSLSIARTSIATRWLLQPAEGDAFTRFTGQVALGAVCGVLLKAMPRADRAHVHQLVNAGSWAPASHAQVRSGSAAAFVRAGHRWAAHRSPSGQAVEWWAWAHDLRHAVRRVVRALAHEGPGPRTSLRSLVHGPGGVTTRGFVEYVRLCTQPRS